MAIISILRLVNATREMLDAVAAKLDLEANPAEGMIIHTAGEIDGQWQIVNVWDSKEAEDRFTRERLGPAVAETTSAAGVTPTPPDETFYELHHLVRP